MPPFEVQSNGVLQGLCVMYVLSYVCFELSPPTRARLYVTPRRPRGVGVDVTNILGRLKFLVPLLPCITLRAMEDAIERASRDRGGYHTSVSVSGVTCVVTTRCVADSV